MHFRSLIEQLYYFMVAMFAPVTMPSQLLSSVTSYRVLPVIFLETKYTNIYQMVRTGVA